MSNVKLDKAKVILHCIGEMYDGFLEEAETVDIAAKKALRKRLVQCTALGVAAASFGVALAYCIFKPKVVIT